MISLNMYWILVYTSVVVSTIAASDDCFTLFKKCQQRHNCLAALINVKFECQDLLFGEGLKGCTQNCKEALNLFHQDKLGKHFLDCACDRDSECLTHQARAGKCFYNRMNNTLIGCSSFSRKCENDTGCTNIMEKFFIKCNHLISGTECTPNCEYVQELLYSHNITKGLLDCECSGTIREENFCRGVRAHTFFLCKNSPLIRKAEEKSRAGEKKTTNEGRKEWDNTVQLSSNVESGSVSIHSKALLHIRTIIGLLIFSTFLSQFIT